MERRSTSNGILRLMRLLRIRWFYAVAALLVAIDPSNAARTEQVLYTKAVSTQLNVTGRAINMPVPLKVGPNEAGEVMVRINSDDSVMINTASLAAAVAGILAGASRARLDALGSGDGFVSIPALNAAGFDVRFDPGLQELSFSPLVDQRPTGEISLGSQRAARISEAAVQPAFISGYLNVFAGFDYIWGTAPLSGGLGGNGTAASGRFDFEVGDAGGQRRDREQGAVRKRVAGAHVPGRCLLHLRRHRGFQARALAPHLRHARPKHAAGSR